MTGSSPFRVGLLPVIGFGGPCDGLRSSRCRAELLITHIQPVVRCIVALIGLLPAQLLPSEEEMLEEEDEKTIEKKIINKS